MSNLLITGTTPINNSKNINMYKIENMIIKFDKAIGINEIGKNIKLLKNDGSNIIIQNNKLSINNNVELKIDITDVSLDNLTEYSVLIPNNLISNNSNGKYFEGINNSATNKWSFTTLDLNGPMVVLQEPKNNAIIAKAPQIALKA